jgi:hypothetical protein
MGDPDILPDFGDPVPLTLATGGQRNLLNLGEQLAVAAGGG